MTSTEKYVPGALSKFLNCEIGSTSDVRLQQSKKKFGKNKTKKADEDSVSNVLVDSFKKVKKKKKHRGKNSKSLENIKKQDVKTVSTEINLVEKAAESMEKLDIAKKKRGAKKNRKRKNKESVESQQQMNTGATPKERKVEAASSTTGVHVDKSLKAKELPRRIRKRRKNYSKEEMERTIFVGNLPLDMKKQKLEELFCKFGKIDTLRLRSIVSGNPKLPKKAAVAKQQFHENASSFNAYVKFQESEAANSAQSLNGTEVGGRHIRVDLCTNEGKNRYDVRRTVFLGNLPFEAEEEGIRSHFQDCGEIEAVRVVRDRSNSLTKGFALVSFKEPTAVELALRLNGEKFLNRELRVTRAVKKVKEKNVKDGKKEGRKDLARAEKTFFKGRGKAGQMATDQTVRKMPPKKIRQMKKKEERRRRRAEAKSLMK